MPSMAMAQKTAAALPATTQAVSRPRGKIPAAVARPNASHAAAPSSRRDTMLSLASLAAALTFTPSPAQAIDEVYPQLCDPACMEKLAAAPREKTASGLEYQDIVVGTGPTPPVGYQVVVNYEAMTPAFRVFDSSIERKAPYDIRVGAGQVVAGLDEGLKTMRVGGLRRLYIPGPLAFPNGLPSGPGRPRVPPGSAVVFDVQLLLIPGLDDDE